MTIGKPLRPYQAEAVAAITGALAAGGRGQFHAACGTGKTLVALRAVERLMPGAGLVIILTPSLALVAQVLGDWERDAVIPFTARAVCSDETVIDAGIADTMTAPVTTDPNVAAGWMRQGGRTVIACTYQSLPALARAMQEAGARAEFLVCDEAHRIAGLADKRASAALDDSVVPAARRLFMTATPRIGAKASTGLSSMDDEGLFGPVLYAYPFSRAIAEGFLDDYRVAVIGISDAEVRALLARDAGGDREIEDAASGNALSVVAAQAALASAAAEFGIRRAVSFHRFVAAAQQFARTLPATLRRMPEGRRPAGTLTALNVHGGMTAAERHRILDSLREPPYGGWSVVSNAQCLTEGVDIPAIDAVLFADPRSSTTDVAQAVGRALRKDPRGTGTATIIVPVIVPAGQQEIGDAEAGAYETVWRVVRAMRAHDESLGAELDTTRTHHYTDDRERRPEGIILPGRITVTVGADVGDRLAASLSLAIVRNTSSPWWEVYAEAAGYAAEHGHIAVPTDHLTSRGTRLGLWVMHCRQDYRRGTLATDRVAALEKLGMAWNAFDERWQRHLEAARAYRAAHGHLRVPQAHVTPDGLPLGQWIKTQRGRLESLDPVRREALEVLGVTDGAARGANWRAGVAYARAWHAEHGHLRIPQRHVTSDGFPLGHWLASRAQQYRDGVLAEDRVAELESLGIQWRVRRSRVRPSKLGERTD